MSEAIWFYVGLLSGTPLGLILACILSSRAGDDRHSERSALENSRWDV